MQADRSCAERFATAYSAMVNSGCSNGLESVTVRLRSVKRIIPSAATSTEPKGVSPKRQA